MCRELAYRVDLLDTIWAELDLRCKEFNPLILVERAVDEGRLNHTTLALSSLEQALSEASTSHSHRQSSRASTVLSLDDLVTTKLDAIDQVIELLASDVAVAGLGDKRDNGYAGVSTDDSNVLIAGVGALDFGNESRGTDDIEGGDTEESLWVVDTFALVNLGTDRDSGVDLFSR